MIKAQKYNKGRFEPVVYANELEMYKELWEDSMRMCDRLSKQNEKLMIYICDLRNASSTLSVMEDKKSEPSEEEEAELTRAWLGDEEAGVEKPNSLSVVRTDGGRPVPADNSQVQDNIHDKIKEQLK